MKKISRQTIDEILIASQNDDPANDFTHPLYRYPASMSPILARQLILSFTNPGDLILDPFCGGGTTAIEATAHGRESISSDLNSLACFITKSKSFPLKEKQIIEFELWTKQTIEKLLKVKQVPYVPLFSRKGKIFSPKTHGLLIYLRDLSNSINNDYLQRYALLTVLRVGKLCFDCRVNQVSPNVLISKFLTIAKQATIRMREYNYECSKWTPYNKKGKGIKVINSNISSLPTKLSGLNKKISLVLTSPPYPGVHILYNRWQIKGSTETDLPYYLLKINDGYSSSYYTFGDRKERENKSYFDGLESAFIGLRKIINKSTIVAQIISFSDVKLQLPMYKELMKRAGYKEITSYENRYKDIFRIIPNRKWYTNLNKKMKKAKEFIFLHSLI